MIRDGVLRSTSWVAPESETSTCAEDTRPQRVLMQAKKKEYVQRLNGLTPPMRCAAQRPSAAGNAGLEVDDSVEAVGAGSHDASARALMPQRESLNTGLQRILPSALLMPGSDCASSANGLWRQGSRSSTGNQAEPCAATPASNVVHTDHSKAWAALQDILTLPDTLSGAGSTSTTADPSCTVPGLCGLPRSETIVSASGRPVVSASVMPEWRAVCLTAPAQAPTCFRVFSCPV